jgi:hypothetical protein
MSGTSWTCCGPTARPERRDYDAIRKTALWMGPVLDDPAAFLADVEGYAALGITQLSVMPDCEPVEYVERLADLLPRFSEL